MQSFNLVRANDSASAISAGAQSDTAQQGARVRFLAGGTTLVDLMKLGVEHPERVIDITRLPLADIRKEANGDLFIGATARNNDVAHHPLVAGGYAALSQALLAGASAQLRNAATTAGNLLQRTRCMYFRDLASPCNKRKPGAGCAAIGGANRMLAILGTSESCIATNPSDMAVAMMAYDAVVHVQGISAQGMSVQGTPGAWQIPLKDFYVLPQDRPDIENVLKPGDLVTHVALPPRPAGERAFYLKLRDRASYEFALVSAAVAVTLAQGKIASARLALGGVGTRPWRVPEAKQVPVGQAPSEAAFRSAAEICLRGAQPQSQNGFKVELAKRCIIHALKHVTN
jgi:xanthine dehydrogenase YagS FAD-binding subunit